MERSKEKLGQGRNDSVKKFFVVELCQQSQKKTSSLMFLSIKCGDCNRWLVLGGKKNYFGRVERLRLGGRDLVVIVT